MGEDANEYEQGRQETGAFFIPLTSYMSFGTEEMRSYTEDSEE